MKRYSLADKVLGDKATDYALNKIVEHDWENPKELVREIADRLVDKQHFLMIARKDKDNEELLREAADFLDADLPKKSPADFVKELEDSEDKVYVWNMHMDDTTVKKFCHRFENEFVEKYNHNPKSLHFIRNDVEGVRDLDSVDLRKALNQIESQGEE